LLDFGCGGGEVVGLALEAGFDAFGVDTFDEGWEVNSHANGSFDGRIQRIATNGTLPFPDAAFDIVVSNQVFEHIEAPLPVLKELARVLRPDGLLVAMFPTREIIIEPHLRVPLVHWLRTGSKLQEVSLRLWNYLSRPHNKDCIPGMDSRVARGMESLRHRIFYRNQSAALGMFDPEFRLVGRGEAHFIADRVGHSRRLRPFHRIARLRVLAPILRWIAVRFAGVVFILRRCA
jgi:SAM-dependent methyltransferase